MKKILLSLIMSCIAFSLFAQKDKSSCLDKSFTFFTGFEGFYLEDCGYAEFGSYSFYNANGGLMTIKEGVYRWVRYRKMSGTNRSVSGLQVIQNHANAIKAVGGEVVKESSGNTFKTTYNGKEIWIYINSSASNMNLDNYSLHSIEVGSMTQELSFKGPTGITPPKGALDSVGLNKWIGSKSMEQLKLINIPATAAEIEAVIPSRLLVAQGLPGSANQPAPGYPVHTIGENYGGGIVFYVYDNGQHGLIAAKEDLGPVYWDPRIYYYNPYSDDPIDFSIAYPILAGGNGVGAGKLNTAIIVSAIGYVYKDTTNDLTIDIVFDYAASLCNNFTVNDNNMVLYGDWYLPSIWELHLLFQQKAVIGNLGSAYYWSSTEKGWAKNTPLSFSRIYVMSFLTGNLTLEEAFRKHPVRPIRSF